MKHLLTLIAIFTCGTCFANTISCKTSIALLHRDTSSPVIVFFEDFVDNKNGWTVTDNKYLQASMEGGLYYLKALRHAFGEAHQIIIDQKKDFEIETRIKILSGNADHKNYYSMLFWGREGLDSYYFTFSKDGYVSVELCDGQNQSDCKIMKGSLIKVELIADDFNVYTIRKTGDMYSFMVNGTKLYEMPFVPFFGNSIGFGAGRKVSLAIDYLRITSPGQ